MHDIEGHRLSEPGGALLQILDQPTTDPASPIARDEMKLAQMKPSDELGHLDPADILPAVADDPRLMLSVSLPKLGAEPPEIPPADLRQMSARAVEVKPPRKVKVARFRRSKAEFVRQPPPYGDSLPQSPHFQSINPPD